MNQLQISQIPGLISQARSVCPSCDSTFHLYCSSCLIPLNHIPPSVSLAKSLIIYKHPREASSKSTAIHAKLLAREDVDLIESDLENHEAIDPSRTLLLYPSAVRFFRNLISQDFTIIGND